MRMRVRVEGDLEGKVTEKFRLPASIASRGILAVGAGGGGTANLWTVRA